VMSDYIKISNYSYEDVTVLNLATSKNQIPDMDMPVLFIY